MAQINGPISIDLLDPPDVNQTQFGPDMKRWLSIIVDSLNEALTSLNNNAAFLISASGTTVGGAGPGPYNVTVTGLTSSGFVNVNLISSTNPATIVSVVPGLNQFSITFDTDPGAGSMIVYQAYIEAPQA